MGSGGERDGLPSPSVFWHQLRLGTASFLQLSHGEALQSSCQGDRISKILAGEGWSVLCYVLLRQIPGLKQASFQSFPPHYSQAPYSSGTGLSLSYFFRFSSIINGCLFLFGRVMQIRFENGAWCLVWDKMFPLNEWLRNRCLRSTYGVLDVLFWLLPVAKTPRIHIKKRTSLFWLHSGGFSLWLGGLMAFSVVGRSHGGEHVIGTCGQGAEWGKQGLIKLNKMLWSKNIFEYVYLC